MHDFRDNIRAAHRVMKEYFPGVNFDLVNAHLAYRDFDKAFAAFANMKLGNHPNILPHPGIIIAAEIRNAQRYYDQQKGAAHAR